MELIFQYPTWFILFCLLLGTIYAAVLYFKANHFQEDAPYFKWVLALMSILRFASVSLLAFLLLSPLIKTHSVEKIEPVIIFAHDNSESILLNLSSEDSAAYINSTNAMLKALSEKYQIDYFSFDHDLKEIDTLDFKGKSTNISEALNQLNGLYYNRNVGAVILATDGIYNEGNNPLYNEFDFPLMCVALGDTLQQTDVKIVQVRANKIAYLDDKVEIAVDMQANHLEGKNYNLSLSQVNQGKSSLIESKSIKIQKDFDEQKTSFTVTAKQVGIQKYRLSLQAFDGEVSTMNNNQEIYIEVIDNRQKILLIANGPHPDIAAIKSVVSLNKNFEMEVQYANKYNANLDNYSLVILHQLPSSNQRAANIFNDIKKAKTPTWHITGASSQYINLNQEQNIVQIIPSGNSTNDVNISVNNSFNSFELSEEALQKIKKYPPLLVPFATYNMGVGSNVLFKQKIGAVETDFPILAFQDNLGRRSAIFVGDGLWRWKLHEYQEFNSNLAFNEMIEKTINYLAMKGDKRKFRTNTNKTAFYEGEMISFEAELYNDSYELINEPEVTLLVSDDEGKEYAFSFSKTEKAYQFKTNSLPLGSYSYKSSTQFNGKTLTAEGAFSISETQLESLHTKANHQLLKQLAIKTKGQFYSFKEVESLSTFLLNQEGIKATLYESFKTRPIINLAALFFIILFFLSLEWFARKWFGAY